MAKRVYNQTVAKRRRKLASYMRQQDKLVHIVNCENLRDEEGIWVQIPALTTRAAKGQVKRLYRRGGFLIGQDVNGNQIYNCHILPQHQKAAGGRSCYSNRDAIYKDGYRGPWEKPITFFLKEGYDAGH